MESRNVLVFFPNPHSLLFWSEEEKKTFWFAKISMQHFFASYLEFKKKVKKRKNVDQKYNYWALSTRWYHLEVWSHWLANQTDLLCLPNKIQIFNTLVYHSASSIPIFYKVLGLKEDENPHHSDLRLGHVTLEVRRTQGEATGDKTRGAALVSKGQPSFLTTATRLMCLIDQFRLP